MTDAATTLGARLNEFERHQPGWAGAEVSDLKRLTDGWESDVYSFSVRPADGDEPRELILRMFPGAAESGPAAKCAKEHRVLRKLYEAGYPVPEVHAIDADGAALGMPSLVMEKISGPTLDATFNATPSGQRRGLITLFAELLADLHALDVRRFEPEPPSFAPSDVGSGWSGPLRGWFQRFGQPGYGPVADWLEHRVETVRRRPPALIHLDYHGNNILMRDGRPYVIDWSSAGISDPRFDLAWTSLLVGGGEVWAMVRQDYERRAGPVDDFDFFEVFACLRRLLSITASLAHGAESLGMRPGVEADMRRAVGQTRATYQLLLDRCGVAIPEVERMLAEA